MLIRILAIVYICLAEGIVLNAQKQYSRFDHLTTSDGLSSNRIWCILRDSKDYLWIGTDVGLDRYDSYEFKKYRFNELQPGTISSDNILCIYEDKDNEMWYGTSNGLNLFDRAKDNFIVFKSDPDDINSLNGNIVNSILEDKAGTLWIVTDGNCLNKWVPETRNFVRYPFDINHDGLYSRTSRMIAYDSKGNIWVVSLGRGIFLFDPASGKFNKFDDPDIDFGNTCFKSLYIDSQDKIWITSDGSGFFSFDPETNKFKHFGSSGNGKGTNRKIILDIIPEDERYLLLAVDQGGINRYDKVTGTFDYIMYGQTGENGLNHNGIWCFHKDMDGILWVGTSGGGINYYNPKNGRFKLFAHNSDNPNSLSFSLVACFYEDYQGMIWIGTDGGGVNVFNPKTNTFKVYKHNPSDPFSISGNVIRSISEDSNRDIWIGTWDAGINRYERKTGKFFRYMAEKDKPSTLSSSNIWNLMIDNNDILWLSNFSVGTDLFDIKKGVIRRFRADPTDNSSISSNDCWLFYEDSKQNIWICTENGLDLYNSKDDSFKVFNFPDNVINAVCVDKEGNLWVGTNSKGVYYCNPDGTILNSYDITNGLPNNRIQAIIEGNKGDLWFSTSSGISCLNTQSGQFRNYSKDDGLQGDQFFQQSFLKTRDGEIYFGGYNGFNSFYPDSLKDNDFIPPVYITDFQIFNKPITAQSDDSQFATDISEAKEIRLKWNQSVFSFSFAAINYTYPEKNKYAYIMEGFEKDWNYTDASRRYITYTNLDPGDYTFKVKASNNDGVWNEKGVSLNVIILPPWWNTLWFKLIVAILLICIISYIVISRVRNLTKQKKLLEKLVVEKTSELLDKNAALVEQAEKLNESNTLLEERQLKIEKQSSELQLQKEILVKLNKELNELNASKDKFFSIIAHDLKNPFNIIIGFSEILKDELEAGEFSKGEEYANFINDSAVQTLRLLENLLEWAKSQSGKIVFKPEPLNLFEICDEEINLLNDLAAGKSIEIRMSVSNELMIIADRNMLKTILRNLISNAIKFTHKNGTVEIKAISKKDCTEISVSDNGIGMTKEGASKLFHLDSNISSPGTENEKGTGLGLLLCKDFIEKHGGQIWVDSEPGRGSTFSILIPSDRNREAG